MDKSATNGTSTIERQSIGGYIRCEVCGGPIAAGVLPDGDYDLEIQCHNKIRSGVKEGRCNHRNRFPRPEGFALA